MQANKLDRPLGALSLLKFTVPSILNLLVMALYQMVDGMFVANFVGENALAALNVGYPLISVILAVALMFATGGSAVVAKNLGEGKQREACENFTAIALCAFAAAAAVALPAFFFLEPLLPILGATGALLSDCRAYLGVLMPLMPLAALQMVLMSFFIVDGRPGLGLCLTVLSGGVNIVLDALFVAVLGWGVRGAALATALGYAVAAVPGFLYYLRGRGGLRFVKPRFRAKALGFTCLNGSSEMVSNLSVCVTTLLFNRVALAYLGEAGVAAVTVALYAQFFLTAVFMGFISGAAPVFSFNLGKNDPARLRLLFRKSLAIVLGMTALVTACAYALAGPIVAVFIQEQSAAYPLALHGFWLFSTGYLFAGFNIFASGLLTALHDGKGSAALSFLRTFAFLVASLLGLPLLIGADGIWLAVPAAELAACAVSTALLIHRARQARRPRVRDAQPQRA